MAPKKKKSHLRGRGIDLVDTPSPLPDLSPTEFKEPLEPEIPNIMNAPEDYNNKPMLLSQTNRDPTNVESAHIAEATLVNKEILDSLGQRIEKAEETRRVAQATLEDLRKTLTLARSLKIIAQRRLQSNTQIESEASFTEKYVPRKTTDNDEEPNAYQPEDVDTLEVITAQIDGLERNLIEASLRVQIEEDSLKTIRKCRSLILSAINRHTALLHRGRGLPNEILLKIFGFTINKEVERIQDDPNSEQNFAVLRISSICSRWRLLVKHTPELWRCIPLPAPQLEAIYKRRLDILNMYIKNNGASGSIILHWPKGSPWVIGGTYTTNVNDPFSFCTSRPDNLLTGLLAKTSSIEFLGRIEKTFAPTVACTWPAATYIFHALIPSYLGQAPSHVTQLTLHFPTLQTETTQNISNILAILGSLKHLDIIVDRGEFNVDWGSATRYLPLLHTFSAPYPLIVGMLRSLFRAPNLRYLYVYMTRTSLPMQTQTQEWEQVKAQLHNIRRLTLIDTPSISFTETHIVPMLEAFAGVESIRLVGKFLSPILSTLSNQQLLLASLQTLVLCRCDIKGSTIKDLIDLHQRPPEVEGGERHQISRVELDGCMGITQTFCEEIMGMVKELVVRGDCSSAF